MGDVGYALAAIIVSGAILALGAWSERRANRSANRFARDVRVSVSGDTDWQALMDQVDQVAERVGPVAAHPAWIRWLVNICRTEDLQRRLDELPPIRGRCAKCASTDRPHLTFRRAPCQSACPITLRGLDLGWLPGDITTEHLHAICGDCGYEWATRCADYTPEETDG